MHARSDVVAVCAVQLSITMTRKVASYWLIYCYNSTISNKMANYTKLYQNSITIVTVTEGAYFSIETSSKLYNHQHCVFPIPYQQFNLRLMFRFLLYNRDH